MNLRKYGINAFIYWLLKLLNRYYEKFFDISLSEKIIILNSFIALFAIILPMAKYYIFEMYFFINNPLAIYLAGIVMIMFISIFFKGIMKLFIRVLINAYYLFWIIYYPLTGELTKASPYEICVGYYINIAVSLIFIVCSLTGYILSYD